MSSRLIRSREASNRIFRFYPTSWPGPVSLGSEPRLSRPTTVRQSASARKFEYLGTQQKGDKKLDKIGSKVLEVKYTTDPNSNLDLKVVKSELKAESSEGTILFDREAGHMVSIKEKVRIKGNITLSAKGMDVPATLDVNIETNVELQPAAK